MRKIAQLIYFLNRVLLLALSLAFLSFYLVSVWRRAIAFCSVHEAGELAEPVKRRQGAIDKEPFGGEIVDCHKALLAEPHSRASLRRNS